MDCVHGLGGQAAIHPSYYTCLSTDYPDCSEIDAFCQFIIYLSITLVKPNRLIIQYRMPPSSFTLKVIELIQSIPFGKVSTYGAIATMAGNRRAARQVSRILHTYSRKEELPWHRVINREGRISIPRMRGYDRQKQLLVNEGILFDNTDRVDLSEYQWRP